MSIVTRVVLEQREAEMLAPYAQLSRESRGRVYPEAEHPLRTAFQRDKDRITHCTAFRRLEYKTQVFVNHEGDYYRTRLTHTIETMQIARTIARTLRLNEDLVEAIALAHDLGHTPFGHSGEEMLNELLQGEGGFEHNAQGLRVVDLLEKRYPAFSGLNLTLEVREGIAKHIPVRNGAALGVAGAFPPGAPLLEIGVVDIADAIAYSSHDVDDGLESGLVEARQLEAVPLWREVIQEVRTEYTNLNEQEERLLGVRSLINLQTTDVVTHADQQIQARGLNSLPDVRQRGENSIAFSPAIVEKNEGLSRFLRENLYNHQRVVRMADKAKRIIAELFALYVEKPNQLPPNLRERCRTESPKRVVADYIAGMTDRYAYEDYRNLFMPYMETYS